MVFRENKNLENTSRLSIKLGNINVIRNLKKKIFSRNTKILPMKVPNINMKIL